MTRVRETLSGAAARFVTLTGLVPQDEAPAFVFASDVLVSPHVPNPDGSAFFGSPTKLFEYMASGKAIIASDLEQIGEVLRPALRAAGLPAAGPQAADGSMAVLTRPGDPGDVAAAIRFLVDRPDWREHLGRNARREALAKYTWDKHVEVIEGALQALQRDGA
jgi:glycosyltransferase involved in cell wall biosynthesis